MTAHATAAFPQHAGPDEEADRYQRFAAAIDAIGAREAKLVGEDDLAWIRKVDRFSKRMEILGRTLIHVSLDPVTFGAGVVSLWIHKQLQVFEVGHTVLHGTYDRFPEAREFHSRTFRWDVPIDEKTWVQTHGWHHHGVNIPGKDDLFRLGFVRHKHQTPHRWFHRLQVPYLLFRFAPAFASDVNFHIAGVEDFLFYSPEEWSFIKDRSLSTGWKSVRKAFRKFLPYYAKSHVLFPLLAGPFFPKVLLGNVLAETMRDYFMAAVIFSNHVADVASYEAGARPRSRGHNYVMQVEATHNFEVGPLLSVLCGGLDHHLEHHLFPTLPPNRLRKIRAEVEDVCKAHGVRYQREPWPELLKKVLRHVAEMSRPPQAKEEPAPREPRKKSSLRPLAPLARSWARALTRQVTSSP